jgi:adenosylhomocysteine nucleosidase
VILAATGLKREARIIGGAGVIAIAGGGDSERLEAKLEARVAKASGVLSIGLAGALHPGMAIGDWVIGNHVVGHGDTDAAWTRRLLALRPAARAGGIFASDHIISNASAKAVIHRDTRALAADMESHVAARVALRHALPLAVVRVISDGADHDLPPAVLVGMKADGGMALGAVLASLAQKPSQLPALIRTGLDAEKAFRSLTRGYDVLARFGFGLPDQG